MRRGADSRREFMKAAKLFCTKRVSILGEEFVRVSAREKVLCD
jgi:hypothetical protein